MMMMTTVMIMIRMNMNRKTNQMLPMTKIVTAMKDRHSTLTLTLESKLLAESKLSNYQNKVVNKFLNINNQRTKIQNYRYEGVCLESAEIVLHGLH